MSAGQLHFGASDVRSGRRAGQRLASTVALLGSLTWLGCGGMTENPVHTGGSAADGGGQGVGGGAQTDAGGAPAAGGGAGAFDGGSGGGFNLDPPPLPGEPEPTWADYLVEGGNGEPFENDLPERPADYLPPLPVGEPGWRDSTQPICSEMYNQLTAELWADGDGVAALVASCENFVLDSQCASGTELWYNDGSGWEWLFTSRLSTAGLAGVSGGDLLVGGPGALAIGRDGEIKGQSPAGLWSTAALFGDGSGPAYVAFSGDPVAEPPLGYLYRYDGSDWTAQASHPSGQSGWGTPSAVTVLDGVAYMAGYGMLVRAEAGADFEKLRDAPSGHHVGIAGLAADDLWLADYEGELWHYDGASWTSIGTFEGAFRSLLATGDAAYFVSDVEFGRVTRTDVEIIQTLDSGRFTDLAGVSANELFLSVLDSSLEETSCGGLQVFMYDGQEFHQF